LPGQNARPLAVGLGDRSLWDRSHEVDDPERDRSHIRGYWRGVDLAEWRNW
jgi:hypothetical protein